MPLAREQRKLAAIVAADVVGYSRLMGRDESGTLSRLKAHRTERLEPALARNGGRLVKLTGDGALAEFGSAVDALRAAIEFQQAVADANSDQPADTVLVFRMGVHLGDLIVDGDDLYGDGVNIAARLEAEAPAGGIVISRAVHEAVTGRLKATFDDLGSLALKNIERPVQAFGVKWEQSDWQTPTLPDVTAPSAMTSQLTPDLHLPSKPAIAVLPFQNMSGDPAQEYLADGIVEDIITNISKFAEFLVISRNSTFTYKGMPVDIAKVGRELKADYVVEGSIRSAGNRVRVTAQLISVQSGTHVWAERYDRDLTDVFELQDEITARIATAVDPAIRQFETRIAMRKHPSSLKAWDHLLRGLWQVNKFRKEANAEGRLEFEAAISQDFNYASAHAWLAMTHVFDAWFNWTTTHADSMNKARQFASRGVALDDADATCHAANAMQSFWSARIEQARIAAERAIAANPNSFLGYYVCGTALNYLGQCETAIPCHLKALTLSPNDPLVWNCLGSLAHSHLNLKEYANAVACADRAIALRHGYLFARLVRIAALAHAGHTAQAMEAMSEVFVIDPAFSTKRLDHYPFILPHQKQHLLNGLAAAGLTLAELAT
jgi:adenylate cyclase